MKRLATALLLVLAACARKTDARVEVLQLAQLLPGPFRDVADGRCRGELFLVDRRTGKLACFTRYDVVARELEPSAAEALRQALQRIGAPVTAL